MILQVPSSFGIAIPEGIFDTSVRTFIQTGKHFFNSRKKAYNWANYYHSYTRIKEILVDSLAKPPLGWIPLAEVAIVCPDKTHNEQFLRSQMQSQAPNEWLDSWTRLALEGQVHIITNGSFYVEGQYYTPSKL